MKLDSRYTQILELSNIAQEYQIFDQEQRHQDLSKLHESLAFLLTGRHTMRNPNLLNIDRLTHDLGH